MDPKSSLERIAEACSELADLTYEARIYSGSVQEGFLSGGSITGTFNNHYLKENSPSDVLNPSSAATLSVQVQHSFLRGFGVAVNARTITFRRINLETSELTFKTQVIGTVANVLNPVTCPRLGYIRSATGTTLEANHISIAEARTGKVGQPSSLPAELPGRQ